MFKQSKRGVVFLILGTILASVLFFGAQPLGSSDRVEDGTKDGYSCLCRIFVKGHHAYALRRTPPEVSDSAYLWVFDVDSIDSGSYDTCATLVIPDAIALFVSGQYLYVGCLPWGTKSRGNCHLKKYSISDPGNPAFVDSSSHVSAGISLTEIYVTDNRAYMSFDPNHLWAFDVSADSVESWGTDFGGHSPQGVHVRGRYMYVANEAEGVWVRDLVEDEDFHGDTLGGETKDVYNVVCDGESRTYEATWHRLNIRDTGDLDSIVVVGQSGGAGLASDFSKIHVTGDWLYWLHGIPTNLRVCEVVCEGEISVDSYYGNDSLRDFHVVHDATGHAHIYGVSPDSTDSGVVLWYARGDSHTVEPYMYGDVNGDTTVDSSDVSMLESYVVDGDNSGLDGLVLDACDVNCDGEVNTDDYDYLSNFVSSGEPVPGAGCQFYHYVFGDANGDGELNVADFVYMINYLYLQKPPPDPMAAGDPNCDCEVDIGDVTYLSNYLFLGDSPPRQGCAE